MASDRFEPLIVVSDAHGLDSTSIGDDVKPGNASALSNVNTWRQQGGLSVLKGRTNMVSFANFANYQIKGLITYEASATDQWQIVALNRAGYTPAVVAYDEANPTQPISGLTNGLLFTQGLQFYNTVYTNAGQQFSQAYPGNMYLWQYPAPNPTTQSYNVSTVSGSLPAGTYYYAFTQVVQVPGASGVQETSPYGSAPLQGPPPPASLYQYTVSSNGISGARLSGIFAGTTPDGASYTTNVYRLSTITDEWYLLANLITNAPYTDNANDTAIQANQILVFNQDPPPLSATNLGYCFTHQERVFTFSTVQNADTGQKPQTQLWWSSLGTPYYFDKVDSVLLVGNSATPNGPSYFGYGDNPAGGISMGGTALVFKSRTAYILFGNDPADYFIAPAFNVGLQAPRSLTYGLGQAFWLANEGPYTFTGSGPQYIGQSIRGTVESIPIYDRINAVGFMMGQAWCLSFPATGITLVYYTVTGDWVQLPYAVSAATFQAANPRTFGDITASTAHTGEAITARAGSPSLDRWAVSENDLGAPITASWTSPLTHSGRPHFRKTYNYIVVCAPFQVGTAQVQLIIDPNNPSRTGAPGTPNAPQTFTTPVIDLSGASAAQPETRHIFRVSPDLKGYQAQIIITYTNTVGQTTPLTLYDVAVLGTFEQALVIPS